MQMISGLKKVCSKNQNTDELTDDSCPCSTLYAYIKTNHQYPVQGNIRQTADDIGNGGNSLIIIAADKFIKNEIDHKDGECP